MQPTIIGLVAAAVSGLRPPKSLGGRPTSDDPAGDARRRRIERARMPGWLDQRDALRDVNSIICRWI
jgi:hypothetical protein